MSMTDLSKCFGPLKAVGGFDVSTRHVGPRGLPLPVDFVGKLRADFAEKRDPGRCPRRNLPPRPNRFVAATRRLLRRRHSRSSTRAAPSSPDATSARRRLLRRLLSAEQRRAPRVRRRHRARRRLRLRARRRRAVRVGPRPAREARGREGGRPRRAPLGRRARWAPPLSRLRAWAAPPRCRIFVFAFPSWPPWVSIIARCSARGALLLTHVRRRSLGCVGTSGETRRPGRSRRCRKEGSSVGPK